jgi:hypothetical protein
MREVKWQRARRTIVVAASTTLDRRSSLECIMKPCVLVALAVLAFAAPSHATAAELQCPIQPYTLEEVEKAIKRAPTCAASLKIFESCGAGASSDVGVGAIVTEKCEAVFAGKLSARQKKAYSRARKTCGTKYAEEDGTMYRSFEAFCYAKAAANMAKQFSKASRATPAKE